MSDPIEPVEEFEDEDFDDDLPGPGDLEIDEDDFEKTY